MASPGLSIAWSDRKRGAPTRKRWELLEPGGFLLIAWLARARVRLRSHSGTRAEAAMCDGARSRENAALGR